MTSIDPGSSVRASLFERIKNILLNPRAEWPRIAAEPETVGSLYTNYIVPVAGFAVLCSFVSSLIGVTVLGVTYRPTYWQALSSGVWQLVFTLGGTYVVALVMGYLAPLFGGENNNVRALKLTAYAATAGWLSNIFLLIPGLGFLTILGIYTLYLIYTGAPVLLNVPPPRALPFTASLVAISIVTTMLIIGLTTAFRSGDGVSADARRHAAEIERRLNGGREAPAESEPIAPDTEQRAAEAPPATAEEEAPASGSGFGALDALTKRLESLSKGSGNLPPIAPADLKDLLPFDLPGGYKRNETSSSETGMEGMNMATASGVYASGDKQITLTISDMGAAGAVAGLATAFGANSSEEKDGVTRKMSTVGGRMVTEEFDTNQDTGMYGVMAADRVMVKAEGRDGASADEIRAAVESVDMGRVDTLAGK
jgi:hypothetical protein